MKIHIETIPHSEQRYDTVGDYFLNTNKIQQVRVSDMGNEDYAFLVALHELVESYLCEKRGISEKDITLFDINFESLRTMHPHLIGDQEPGDMVSAPYHKEHIFATKIEKLVAEELGVDWKKYEDKINSL